MWRCRWSNSPSRPTGPRPVWTWHRSTPMSDKSSDDSWKHGLDIVEKVYGAGTSAMMQGLEGQPFVAETVRHLFGEIWSRPGLSMRDKRLLVIGATAMLGRADLVAIQVAGAIV